MKKIWFVVGLVFVFMLLVSILCIILFSHQISEKVKDYDDKTVFNLAQNSRIYASDGTTVLAELQIENREPLDSLDEISPYVLKATQSIEDARFYEHKGVDYWALLRSFSVIATGGNTQGGSTITMQLVRNTILSKEAQVISIERKLSEIILAQRIEEIYSKDEILLMYLNTINYGDGCYGIKAASKHYFSVEPIDLNLNQSATLAGIPQSPSYLSPTTNITACTYRRNLVLGRMCEDHIITPETDAAESAAPIELNISYNDPSAAYKYPYFTNYVRQKIMDSYSTAEIFEGGFQIYTTLDVKHQEACELGCSKSNAQLEKGAESVAVSIDVTNGHITGIVGGDDYSKNQYNIATSKGRPTGSSFKMFTLATAIEQGYDPFSYTVDCSSPMKYGDITIQNIYGIDYGTKTIQGATAVSSNTGFVRLQEKVQTLNVIEMARRLGVKNAYLPAEAVLTLGIADINPVEMASAYATVANGGVYHEPVSILKIETANGDEIYTYDESENPENGQQVIDPKVASAITKVLKTVFTEGTAVTAKLANNRPVAGKTGTSEDNRDHTLIGYTPKVALATWIGKRDYSKTASGVTCNTLFKTIMDEIHKDDPIEDFPEMDDPGYTKTSDKIKEKTPEDKLKNAPNVVGKDLSVAKSTLYAYNLKIYRVFSDTYANNIVTSQRIEDGYVVLEVSKGPKTKKN